MSTLIQTPVVHDESSHEYMPMSPGAQVPASIIPVSDADGNLLEKTDDGLFVNHPVTVSADDNNKLTTGSDGGAKLDLRDIVSPASGNIVRVAKDGGLYAPSIEVSQDADNLLGYGKDKGITLAAGDVLSNTGGNLLHVGEDNKITLTQDDLRNETVVSGDEGNLIRAGVSDQGAYLDADSILSNDANNALSIGNDGRVMLRKQDVSATAIVSEEGGNFIRASALDGGSYLDASGVLSSDGGNLLERGGDGKVKLTRDALDIPPTVSADNGNLLHPGVSDQGAYLNADGILSNDANNALSIGSDGRVMLRKQDVSATAIVSDEGGNFIRPSNLDGGAYLDAAGVLSLDEGNALARGTDGKIFLNKDSLHIPPTVSTDEGNLIRKGVGDGGAYLDTDSVLSNEEGNLLFVSPVDHRVMLKRDDLHIPDEVTPVSGEYGNVIREGLDGGSYLPWDFGTM